MAARSLRTTRNARQSGVVTACQEASSRARRVLLTDSDSAFARARSWSLIFDGRGSARRACASAKRSGLQPSRSAICSNVSTCTPPC
jgi:hypothetical protein